LSCSRRCGTRSAAYTNFFSSPKGARRGHHGRPFVLDDGHPPVPRTPGIGTEPLPEALRRFITARRDLYGGRAER
jgi:hypothetical protein